MSGSTGRVPFSFELFPPRSPSAEVTLWDTIQRLAATGPDFMSVTYGANGSSRQSSLDVLRYLREETRVHPLAHLTCVGSSHFEANRLVREFLDAGITSFLALRGDPPKGAVEGDAFLGDLGSASELVQLIHRVQTERAQYATLTSLSGGGRLPERREKVRVAVAAFPNGHPRSTRTDQDIDTLLAKQVSGATMAITQLFFHAEDYLSFVADARAAGVTIPILPGIMPATTPARLERILELTGERRPTELSRRLHSTDSTEEQFDIGVEHAIELSSTVIDGGAPGLHLYTFNQHQAVISVLEDLNLTAPIAKETTV
ncbi:methylenetetrahydrofolate reductase [Lacisediminihabitans changchengi]|uniref:Methylenetetrahydrofolate reductase n=1 Tax=Lacisediminihabitans changchengi TaxID=2787634 RepID=A0A934W3U6_9MICO|nr:methylenetetrahydrofolate reductase [Lacisediminihabitans changchengi]MBK4347614.1 methylenetetrahydrofolate reductase [Lacisediminihabitans changchengi]